MKTKSVNKSIIIVGFALFAAFFGAGNLIFPPSLGITAGKDWLIAIGAFLISGIILPLCSFIAVSKGNGTEEGFASELGPVISKILIAICMICGPIIIIVPRTAAVSYEVGLMSFTDKVPNYLYSLIYFIIVLIFTLNPSSVVDKIGKILTPFLLIAMVIIIVTGVITPVSEIADVGAQNVFGNAFVSGYQTLDALGGICFGGAIMAGIIARGHTEENERKKVALGAAVIAGLGLLFIYGGLCYLGATASSVYPTDMEQTALLLAIIGKTMGNVGLKILGIAMILACLTSAISGVSGVSAFFERITKNKLPYKFNIIGICVIGWLISNLSVSQIINMAAPILTVIYPVIIVLILLGLVKQKFKTGIKGIYMGATYTALVISLMETFGQYISAFGNFIKLMPLASYGFAWLVPAILGGLIGWIIAKKKNISSSQ